MKNNINILKSIIKSKSYTNIYFATISIIVILLFLNLIFYKSIQFYIPLILITLLLSIPSLYYIYNSNFISIKILSNLKNSKYFGIIFLLLLFTCVILEYLYGNQRVFSEIYTNNHELINFLKFIIYLLTFLCGFVFIFSKYPKHQYNKKVSVSNNTYKYLVFLVFLVFIALKFSVISQFSGSYIDEYYHIIKGLQIDNVDGFNNIFQTPYVRGLDISLLCSLIIKVFNFSIFNVKLVPAIIGIINFFLVYCISKQLIQKKWWRIVLLLIYTFSPWVIFNHFYIRFYSTLEFYILSLILLFLLLFKYLENKKSFLSFFIFVIIIIDNLLCYILTNDAGRYMIILFTIINFILFCFRFIPLNIINKRLKYLKYLTPIIIIVGLIIFIKADLLSYLNFLINGDVTWTSGYYFKFNNLFLNLNIFFTVCFLSGVLLLKRIDSKTRIIYLASLSLFIIHLVSSPDLQMTRTILYFLPVYYLFSIVFISNLTVSKLFKFSLLLIISVTIFINFPKDYLYGPYIPSEITYTDFERAYKISSNLCKDGNIYILTSAQWTILPYYHEKNIMSAIIDPVYLSTSLDYLIDKQTNKIVTTPGNIPVEFGRSYVDKIKYSDKPTCVITYYGVYRPSIEGSDYTDLFINFFKIKFDFREVRVYYHA